jgi:hypothetical protein
MKVRAPQARLALHLGDRYTLAARGFKRDVSNASVLHAHNNRAVLKNGAVVAQQAPQGTHDLDEIVVVGVSPVPGFKVDKDKIPGNIQTLRSSDLTRNGAANVLGALTSNSVPSISTTRSPTHSSQRCRSEDFVLTVPIAARLRRGNFFAPSM